MEAALDLRPFERYEAPALTWDGELAQEEHGWVLVWAIVVGFSFAAALAYAAYCTASGGDPDISFGWSGFKGKCYRYR